MTLPQLLFDSYNPSSIFQSAPWNLPHILQSEQSPKKLEVEMVILWLPSLLLSIVLSLGLTFLVNLLLKK